LFFIAFWLRDTIIRLQLQSILKQQTGCKISIDSVQSNLYGSKFIIEKFNLHDTNSNSPQNTLLQIDKISINGNPKDLSQRYIHLPEINIDGAQITLKKSNAESIIPAPIYEKIINNNKDLIKFMNRAKQLGLIDLLEGSPEKIISENLYQLETFNLAKNLKSRWQNKSLTAYNTQLQLIHTAFQNLSNKITKIQKDKNTISSLKELETDINNTYVIIETLYSDLNNLKKTLQSDYKQFSEAISNDKKKLSQLTLYTPTNSTGIFEILIGDEIYKKWHKLLTWPKWIDLITESIAIECNSLQFYQQFGFKSSDKFKGEKIHFANLETRPDIFIDKLKMTGAINLASLPVYFNCEASNIAAPMRLAIAPLQIKICFSGSGIAPTPTQPGLHEVASTQIPAILDPNILPNIYVTLNINRTGTETEDQLIIRCPIYKLPERIVGNQNNFAIKISPGNSALDVEININKTNINGYLRLIQNNVNFTLIRPTNQPPLKYEKEILKILNSIHNFTAEIHVNGDPSNPVYSFKSNFTDNIAKQLEIILLQEWEIIKNKIHHEIDTQNNYIINMMTNFLQNDLEKITQEINNNRENIEKQLIDTANTLGRNPLEKQMIQITLKTILQKISNNKQPPSQ
jgi:hypothetical protein